MSLHLYQISRYRCFKVKRGYRKWLKNQRNRKIRRVPKNEIPNIKYKFWDS